MGLGEANLSDDQGGDGNSAVASTISCSICLEAVTENGDRSTAKLQCGHEFHLDCIGSAFNAKGLMQCPNCRKIEKGQWLYANGYRSVPEFSLDDWTHDEDLYDLSYTEMPFGVHWCPFSGLTRLSSSFEEAESPSTAYRDFPGHNPFFSEHATASSAGHSCPYVAYIHPLQPSSSSNSADSIVEGPSFHHNWSSILGPTENPTSHAFPPIDRQYHGWEHSSPPFSPPNSRISAVDQASISSTAFRSGWAESDGSMPGTGSLVPLLLSHGSAARAGSSVVSSVLPPYPSHSRGHPRIQGIRAFHQQSSSTGMRSTIASGARRSNGPRGISSVGPAPTSSDLSGGYYVLPPSGSSARNMTDTESPAGSHFYAWERDRFAPYPLIPVDTESSLWSPFAGTADSASRNGFWRRHPPERPSSQGRAENASFQSVHLSQMHPYL